MIDALLRRLSGTAPVQKPDPGARVALAALLVRIARTDGHYAEEEAARIDAVLAARFGLAAPEATALRAAGEALEAGAPDTVRFTRAIKDTVAHDDRAELMEALWTVVLADGERDDHEDAMIRLVARLLGMSDRDSALARQRAERRA